MTGWLEDNSPGLYRPPYPDDSIIRKVASFFGRYDVLEMLEKIAVQVVGDAPRVYELAIQFAGNQTLQHAHDDIADAKQRLVGAWAGYGYDQFTSHADRVAGVLQGNQQVVRNFSTALSAAAETVVNTYISLVRFVGNCVATLAGLGTKIAIAMGTAPIPIVDIFTSSEVLNTIGDAFTTFMRDANAEIFAAGQRLAQHVTQAVAFVKEGASYQEVPALDPTSGVDDRRQWKINPNAYPDS